MYKFSVYPDSGGYCVDLIYTRPDQSIAEEKRVKFYWTKEPAMHYAQQRFAEWLCEHLRKYVYHADILFNTSNNGFYSTRKKEDSLERLKAFLRIAGQQSTRMLVLMIFTYEQDLVNILPSPYNPSFFSAHDKLEDLLAQCRRYRSVFIKSGA